MDFICVEVEILAVSNSKKIPRNNNVQTKNQYFFFYYFDQGNYKKRWSNL